MKTFGFFLLERICFFPQTIGKNRQPFERRLGATGPGPVISRFSRPDDAQKKLRLPRCDRPLAGSLFLEPKKKNSFADLSVKKRSFSATKKFR